MKTVYTFMLCIKIVVSLGQTIIFENKAKYITNNKVTSWKSKTVYNDKNEILRCDTLDKTEKCSSKQIQYKYELLKDTIFIVFQNSLQIQKRHPQYILNKKDTISFLREDDLGFNFEHTQGYITYIKDTVLNFNGSKYDCYLFEKRHRRRDNSNHIGYIEVQYIYINKNKLYILQVETSYFNPFKNRFYKNAYAIKKAIKIYS